MKSNTKIFEKMNFENKKFEKSEKPKKLEKIEKSEKNDISLLIL